MHFKMSSAIRFNLDQSKMLSSGNGLNCNKRRTQNLVFRYTDRMIERQLNFDSLP